MSERRKQYPFDVLEAKWQAKWAGRRIYDEAGDLRFAINHGKVEPGSAIWLYEVDALTGATVTADAVTSLIHYWFGPNGYRDYLDKLRQQQAEVS